MRITNKAWFFNFRLFFNIILILGLGLLAIYSVSFEAAGFNNFYRQLMFAGIALVLFLAASRMNYGVWENYARLIYLGGVILMVLVLFWGERKHGTAGWIGYASYHLQSVEVMKVGVILVLARHFAKIRMDDKRLRHLVISGLYCLIPIGLALLQPDLGSAAVIFGIWLVVILVWGTKKRYLAGLAGILLLVVVIGWLAFLKPYQKARIGSFLDPYSDPSGSGYHVLQSMTAIGSGRLYGKGLGYGSQSQLHFLPEAHTDFIYAVICEELGFLGAGMLLVAFGLLFWGIYRIATRSTDNFGRFIAVGVMAMFFIQFLVNVGMNLGLVPVTGLPLPLVSYGGSALLVEMFLLGVIFSIYTVSRKTESYR